VTHLVDFPFIILTAEYGEEIRTAASEVHASGFLNKPAKSSELKEKLSRILHQH
jgi:CheY-like chemotaxis protein